jgi:hypothetical protein
MASSRARCARASVFRELDLTAARRCSLPVHFKEKAVPCNSVQNAASLLEQILTPLRRERLRLKDTESADLLSEIKRLRSEMVSLCPVLNLRISPALNRKNKQSLSVPFLG